MSVMETGGTSQDPQQRDKLDLEQTRADTFASMARRVTQTINELLRTHQANGFGADMGSAAPSDYVTSSNDSRTVGDYRKLLKAACSYAVVVGEMSQSKANSVLQTAYGNDTETTVSSDQISDLTDQWV